MNRVSKFAVATTAILLTLPAYAFAHGGQYRGPGDTVDPGNRGGGNGRSGSGGPTTPGPGGPDTPGPSQPAPKGGRTGGTGGGGGNGLGPVTGGRGGVQVGEDFTQWLYWWEFNKDPFLNLKSKIWQDSATTGLGDIEVGRGEKTNREATRRPSPTDLKSRLIPALERALADPSSNTDILSSSMLALAKVSRDASLLPKIRKFLKRKNQEEQESAALAMGISAKVDALDDLLALARDSKRGRALADGPVSVRTRSFACYGCGLVAHETTDVAVKRRVFEAMTSMLDDPRVSRRDVQVAALNAIRLLRLSDEGQAAALRKDAVDYLVAFTKRSNADVISQVRAHAYGAIARLVGRSASSELKAHVLAPVLAKNERDWIRQSAILALGQIATAADTKVSAALRAYSSTGKNQQAKRFAYIALGRIGGEANVNHLRKRLLSERTQDFVRPWLAIGLALAHRTQDGVSVHADSVAADIERAYRGIKAPIPASGMAIALGILGSKDAEDLILDRMIGFKNDEQAAGYHAVALGLIGHQYAKEDIRSLLDSAERKDTLLTQTAIALGLLGDKEVSLDLIDRLTQHGNSVAVSSALAQAIGFIGDRRSIDGLVTMLDNRQLKNIPRAFSAVALGLIGDKEALPWNSKIAQNINYRANVGTLTGNSTGVLDIL